MGVVEFFPVDYCDFSPCNPGCLRDIDASNRDYDPSSPAESVACCPGNLDRFQASVDSSVACVPADMQIENSRFGLAPAALAERASRSMRITLMASNLSMRCNVWEIGTQCEP